VAQNLLRRWLPHCESIDVWGINFSGWPHELPYRIYPAGYGDWCSRTQLQAFVDRAAAGNYTHLWILQDLAPLCQYGFPAALAELRRKKGLRIVHYMPVDAPLDPAWLEIVRAVDVPVAYTEYGVTQIAAAAHFDGAEPPVCHILPHGVDTDVYHPLQDRGALREKWFGEWVKPTDTLLLNVNANQPRKGHVNTLQIVAELKRLGVPVKLLMHMPNENSMTSGHSLTSMAYQLGLDPEDWSSTDQTATQLKGKGLFWAKNHPLAGEPLLNELYNCADLLISTTLGEGWGFSLTEALAAGCPVAAPSHTSCQEIARDLAVLGMSGRFCLLPYSSSAVMSVGDTRVRYPVDVSFAVRPIEAYLLHLHFSCRAPLTPEVRRWLSWDRIALAWIKLFRG